MPTPLEHKDLLALIAEVSAAFVGFSMVVGVLRPEQTGEAGRMRSMRAVAETGLIAGGGAVFALVLDSLALPHRWVWRLSGLVVAVGWLVAFTYAIRRFRAAGEQPGARDAGLSCTARACRERATPMERNRSLWLSGCPLRCRPGHSARDRAVGIHYLEQSANRGHCDAIRLLSDLLLARPAWRTRESGAR